MNLNRDSVKLEKGIKKIMENKCHDTNESVTFKITHFAFVNKGQISCIIILILTLIDKCKMCHFECHRLKYRLFFY